MNHGRQKGEFVTPKAILTLMDQEGPTRAAKELGVSTTTLFKARRGGQVSRAYEVAARTILGNAKLAKRVTEAEKRERALLEAAADAQAERDSMLDEAAHTAADALDEEPAPQPETRKQREKRELLMFEVPKEKEAIIRRAVRSLGGEVVN